jgi:hypothetical protein
MHRESVAVLRVMLVIAVLTSPERALLDLRCDLRPVLRVVIHRVLASSVLQPRRRNIKGSAALRIALDTYNVI